MRITFIHAVRLIACVILLPALLAGCGEEYEFTRQPAERASDSKLDSVSTQVFVADRVPISDLEADLESDFKTDITSVRQYLKRAACVEHRGRKVCRNARVTGSVFKDGPIKISGDGQNIQIEVPLGYELSAKGLGSAKSIEDSAKGKATTIGLFSVALDEELKPRVVLGKKFRWINFKKTELLGREVDIQKDVERRLYAQLQRMARKFREELDISPLITATSIAWRHLHYPIQLSKDPEVWIRGKPSALHFAGFSLVDGELEMRIAVATDLKTTIGERPVPLLPRHLPKVSAEVGTDHLSRLIMPVEFKYEDLKKNLTHSLPPDTEIKAGNTDEMIEFTVTKTNIYPAERNLALAVGLEVDVPDRWTNLTGTAYLIGKPRFHKSKGTLGIDRAKFSKVSPDPALYNEDDFILPEKLLADAFEESALINIRERFASVLSSTNTATTRELGEGLWLEGRFKDLEVQSVVPGREGLLINLALVGDLTILLAEKQETEDSLRTTSDKTN